jgi:hypothetical protein
VGGPARRLGPGQSGNRRDRAPPPAAWLFRCYARIADTIVRHIDVRLIPLIEGLPEQLRAAGRQWANDYRVFLLQDQFDAAEIEIDDGGQEYRVGIDELLPLVEPRCFFAGRLRHDAGKTGDNRASICRA